MSQPNQRVYPRLQGNSVAEIQKIVGQIFDNIYQLQSTIAQQTLFIAPASQDFIVEQDAATVPGTVLRLEAGSYVILGIFEGVIDADANQITGQFAVGGIPRSSPIAVMLITGTGVNTLEATSTQVWEYSSASPGTVSLWAQKSTAIGNAQLHKSNTQLVAIKVG